MRNRYVTRIILMVSVISNLISCTNQSIPDRNKELTSDMTALIELESMNDVAVHVADVYLNFLETITNHDPKDSIYSLPNESYFEVVAEGVVVRIKNHDRNKYPKDVRIDFGTQGVRLRNGNLYTGQIYIHETAAMTDSNATRTYVFTNLSINDHQLHGINTVTFLGQRSDSNPRWNVESKDTVIFKDGRKLYWHADRTRTCINGNPITDFSDIYENTIDSVRFDKNEDVQFELKTRTMMIWDNHYSVSGKSNGVDSKGNAFSMQILDGHPLVMGKGFPYYISGKCLLHSNHDLMIIDLGDQKKDYWVTTTLHGVTMDYNMLDHYSSF